ncbi:MAG TPA: iron-containing alcohol dehydrogenase [Candidatus Latescibacteria bacterium]|nr:iron-containing alcohol dehydrogenase [Candidatus Latescibacterota bacterium]
MFTLMYPTKIIFGEGVLELLGKEAKCLGTKALLVTGRSAMQRAGALDRVRQILMSRGLGTCLFDHVERDPCLSIVDRGVKLARSEECDLVVALGGGSAIDVGKAIAVIAGQEGTIWDYHRGREIENSGLPFVAIPTTAGTGAEITNNAVLIDREKEVKKSLRSPMMIARLALVDPELTVTMPPEITAQTGMDALTQAIEAYVTRASNPVTDILALRAAEIIYHNLPVAVEDSHNRQARYQMALGSLLGAMAFSNSGLGAVHGLAHPIGALFNIPHGLVCAVLLPHVMSFNLQSSRDKYYQLAVAFGADTAEGSIEKIRELERRIKIPESFKGYGISEFDLDRIVSGARSSSMSKNPREASDEELKGILLAVI